MIALRMGDSPAGYPIVKFTLTYEGPLGSNRPEQKWAIRHAIQPQLVELWTTNPVLGRAMQARVVVGGGSMFSPEQHHSEPAPEGGYVIPDRELVVSPEMGLTFRYLNAPIERHGARYSPLVRESMGLICRLDILFLRKEEPGALIKQGGDIDNRLKTLFDGLRMPSKGDQPYVLGKNGPELVDPFCTLLEEDSLVTGVSVDTARLLTGKTNDQTEVKLIINVTVSVTHVRAYNLSILGD